MELDIGPGIHPVGPRTINHTRTVSSNLVHISAATLDAYYANTLAPGEARSVRNHLVFCTECRRTVLQMQSLVRLLRRLEGQSVLESDDGDLAA